MRLILPILLFAIPAHAGNGAARYSVAASDSLSTTASCEELTEISGTDAGSEQIPSGAYMSRLDLTLTSIAGGATSVTVWLARSSDGEDAITDQVTETIVDEDADGNGTTSTAVNSPWVDDATTGHQPYVCAKTGTGTATSVARLVWEKR